MLRADEAVGGGPGGAGGPGGVGIANVFIGGVQPTIVGYQHGSPLPPGFADNLERPHEGSAVGTSHNVN